MNIYRNFLLLLIFGILSCTNPFNLRDIEEPDINDESDIFDQPISSDVVISNFRYSVVQKNISNHINCFVDLSQGFIFTYRFVPDPSVETEKFRNWVLMDEKSYLNTVFKQSGKIALEFLDTITFTNISQSPDSVQTNSIRYILSVTFESENMVYTGSARMKLVKNINAMWAIYYWEDTKSTEEDSRSWSNLKANFKN